MQFVDGVSQSIIAATNQLVYYPPFLGGYLLSNFIQPVYRLSRTPVSDETPSQAYRQAISASQACRQLSQPYRLFANNLHRPVRCIAVSKAPCVLCCSLGTPGSEGGCIPLSLGQPPGICLPAYCHRNESFSQTDSLSHLRSHPDRPLFGLKENGFQLCGTFCQTFQ